MDLTTLNCLNARAKIGHSFSGSIYQIYKAGAGHYINIVKMLNSLRNRNLRARTDLHYFTSERFHYISKTDLHHLH